MLYSKDALINGAAVSFGVKLPASLTIDKMIEKIERFAQNFDLNNIKNIELKFSSHHHSFINSLNDDLNTALSFTLP